MVADVVAAANAALGDSLLGQVSHHLRLVGESHVAQVSGEGTADDQLLTVGIDLKSRRPQAI
jgi:hypothetical protein